MRAAGIVPLFVCLGIVGCMSPTVTYAASPSPSPSRSPLPSSSSAPAPPAGANQLEFGVWTLYAAPLDLHDNGDFSTPRRVLVKRVGIDIEADRMNGNYKAKHASLFGHVVIHDSRPTLSGAQAGTSRAPAMLMADQAMLDDKAKEYIATGHVHYVQGDLVADADNGRLDEANHVLMLDGNVHMKKSDRTLRAQHVTYDTIADQAHAEGDVEVTGAWTLRSASLDLDTRTGDFMTPDHVSVVRNGGDVSADRMNGNDKTQRATLDGHVVAHSERGEIGPVGALHSAAHHPSTLTADHADLDDVTKLYTATGNVHYVQGVLAADADTGILSEIQHRLVLQGNVHMNNAGRTVNAHRLLYDTRSGDTHIDGGVDITVPAPSPAAIPRKPPH